MLSILIPTYNYNVYPLAQNLQERAQISGLTFELICIDDGSHSNENLTNEKINKLPNCLFIENETNQGRTATRQELAKKAKYDWLLFLDADVMPKYDAFLTQYIRFINGSYSAIFGGIAYNEMSYKPENALRYTYGKEREVMDAEKRNKNPYKVVCSANFMIKKSIFIQINALNLQHAYGLDYLFGTELQSKLISIFHINNEVYHLGIDINSVYLNKTKQALQTLYKLNKTNQLKNSEISLLKAYSNLKAIGLHHFFGYSLNLLNKPIERYLLNIKSPNLFIFDLYRLGYFCRISSNL
jgi:glycosyltransferase involved in cell wall biosynthesis